MSETSDFRRRRPARQGQASIQSRGAIARGIERPTRRSRRTRAELVAAARTVLEEEGLAALTVREVTTRADMAHGTFYHHFGSTEEVLAAVVGGAIREMAEDLARELADVEDRAWVLVQSLARTVAMLIGHPARDAILERPIVLAESLREHLAAHVRRDVDAWAAIEEIDVARAERIWSLWPWLVVGTLADVVREPRRSDELVAALVEATLAAVRIDEARLADLLTRLRVESRRRTKSRRKSAITSRSRKPTRGRKTS